MELKQIQVDKILANFYQPRVKFEKEGIKELAESILSNGLINPITVREWKGNRFMIVAGERRWRAHKVANLKTIPAIIKEYKSDGQFMVESLIENLHRDDLSDSETIKFANKIMKEEGIKTIPAFAKRIAKPERTVSTWFQTDRLRKSAGVAESVSQSVIVATQGLPEKQRIELIKQAEKEDFGSGEMAKRVSERKSGERPEPIDFSGYERVANDVASELLDDFSSFTNHTNELVKEMNVEDLSKGKAERILSSTMVFLYTTLPKLLEFVVKKGVKPDKRIEHLIKFRK